MDHIGPADGLLNHLYVSVGIGKAAGLDDGLEDGKLEFLQRKIRLGAVGVGIGTCQDTYILSDGSQGRHRPAGRCRNPVSRDIVVVDYKKNFHSGRKGTNNS